MICSENETMTSQFCSTNKINCKVTVPISGTLWLVLTFYFCFFVVAHTGWHNRLSSPRFRLRQQFPVVLWSARVYRQIHPKSSFSRLWRDRVVVSSGRGSQKGSWQRPHLWVSTSGERHGWRLHQSTFRHHCHLGHSKF